MQGTGVMAIVPNRKRQCSTGLMAVNERDLGTGLLVGHVPGISAAQTQGQSIDEVCAHLAEVIRLLRRQGALQPESEFIALTRL